MDEVFDEWKQNKTRFGYGQFFDEWSERDVRDMVRRDRNHPSIVLWSIGNEILEQRNAQAGEAMATRLAGFVRAEDPTRPVTAGMNNPAQAMETGFAKPLDVIGLNYNLGTYDRVRTVGKSLASETSSNYSSRDQYNLEIKDGQVTILNQRDNHTTSYDLDFPRWGNTAEKQFQALATAPWMAGEFVWTGFDYIGEPTPFRWPNRSSSFGIVDLAGFPKDRFYLYRSQWRKEPIVHILPHWTWPDQFKGKEIPVWAYTNAESVELFVNTRSLGVRTWADVKEKHLTWQVPYEPGRLRAVARKGGKVAAGSSGLEATRSYDTVCPAQARLPGWTTATRPVTSRSRALSIRPSTAWHLRYFAPHVRPVPSRWRQPPTAWRLRGLRCPPDSAQGTSRINSVCQRVQCRKCGKPTWIGCGRHIEEALRGVPPEQRCQCPRPKSLWARLFGRW